MEENKEREIRIADLFGVLKKCWILMLVVFLVIGCAMYVFMTLTHSDLYQSTTTLYLYSDSAIVQDGQSNSAIYQLDIAAELTKDFKKMSLMEDLVLYPTILALEADRTVPFQKGELTPSRLKNGIISIQTSEDSRWISVVATYGTPEQSAQISNVFTEIACNAFNEQHTDGTWNIVHIKDRAKAPAEGSISNPISMVKILAISLIGAFAIYAVYFLRHLFDDNINTEEDVSVALGAKMLGIIPNREEVLQMRGKKYGKYGAYYGRYGQYGAYGARDSAKDEQKQEGAE